MSEKESTPSLVRRLCFPPSSVRWLIWSAYAVAWTTALLVPVPEMPAATGLQEPHYRFLFAKTVHVSAYALFTVLSAWLLVSPRYRWLLIGFLVAHAAGTEILQALLPTGRTGCIEDVGIDLIGIALGLALSWRCWRSAVTPAPVHDPGPCPPASATAR
jgi:VanZ family protein